MINISLKTRVTFNLDGCKDELFIGYNKENDVEEIAGEVDHATNYENKESDKNEIVKEETGDPINENCLIILVESDDKEEEKDHIVKRFFIF